MSGIFTAVIPFTAQTAQVDLLEAVANSAKPLVLLELHLSQSSEVSDAQEEQLVIHVKSGQTTSGSGGNAAASANPTDSAGSASSFQFETHNTTKASTGTIVTHLSQSWNVRGPLDLVFTELSQLIFAAGRRMTIELGTTPGDSITLGGWALFQEIG